MLIRGSAALAAGTVTRHQLNTSFDMLHRDVYVARGTALTPADKAMAAWMWADGRGVAVGLSAAALHGTKWIDPAEPAELNQASRHKTRGILLHSDRLTESEICVVDGIRVTPPARTAFDLGRRRGLTQAVTRVDALLQAVPELQLAEVQALVDGHGGARGMVQLRKVLGLVDYGAESPQETRLRLVLTWERLPPSATQINVYDGYSLVGRLDMGWPEWKVGVQYDGAQHWTDPRQRTLDIEQDARYRELGWRIIRVGAELLRYRRPTIIRRVRAELDAAGAPHPLPNVNTIAGIGRKLAI
ncbi:endonuclease domain-containing protein [Mycobacterium sp. NPDC003323]